MTNSRLENLARIGQLKPEAASSAEFEGLVRSGQRRLQDAANETLNLESRFDLAYNAAHALALAALRWHGDPVPIPTARSCRSRKSRLKPLLHASVRPVPL